MGEFKVILLKLSNCMHSIYFLNCLALEHQMLYNEVMSEEDWNLLSVRNRQMLAFSSDILLIKQESLLSVQGHQKFFAAFKTCVPIACGVLWF